MANLRRTRHQLSGDQADLTRSIDARRRSLLAEGVAPVRMARRYAALGRSLFRRSTIDGWAGAAQDADESVRMLTQALQLTPSGHRAQMQLCLDLSFVLASRDAANESDSDLEESLRLAQQARSLAVNDRQRAECLAVEADRWLARHIRHADPLDVLRAVDLAQQAVDLTPAAERRDLSDRLSLLALAQQARNVQTPEVATLDALIATLHRLLDVATAPEDRATAFLALRRTLADKFELTGEPETLNAAIAAARQECESSTDPAERITSVSALEDLLHQRHELTGRQEDLDECITLAQHCVELSDDDIQRSAHLLTLGVRLETRFDLLDMLQDLEESIAAHRASLALTPRGGTTRSRRLSSLDDVLHKRYKRLGEQADLDGCIEAMSDAVRIRGDEAPPWYVTALASRYVSKYEATRDPRMLEEAIQLRERALATADSDRPDHANRLANTLIDRFWLEHRADDIRRCIELYQFALDHSSDTADQAVFAGNLGLALENLFEQSKDAADLDLAVQARARAVVLTPADARERPVRLAAWANRLLARYRATRQVSDVDAAIGALAEAVDLADPTDPELATWLSKLGGAWRSRFFATGERSAIDEAVTAFERGAQVTPTGHRHQAAGLAHVGDALVIRFHRYEDVADLDRAFDFARAAIQAAEHSGPAGHFHCELAELHRRRYRFTGDAGELDREIEARLLGTAPGERNLGIQPDCHLQLSIAFRLRHEVSEIQQDLQAWIAHSQIAVDAAAVASATLTSGLKHLAWGFDTAYQKSGIIDDLEQEIATRQRVVEVLPESDGDRVIQQGLLADAYWSRYRALREGGDLDKCIAILVDVVGLAPTDHPARDTWLFDLAIGHRERYRLTGAAADLNLAIEFRRQRLDAAGQSGRRASDLESLARDLWTRYEPPEGVADLDEVIDLRREALALTAEPAARLPLLQGLGSALGARIDLGFSLRADPSGAAAVAYVSDGVLITGEAVAIAEAAGMLTAATLSEHAWALWLSFFVRGVAADFDNAVSALERAIRIGADEPEQQERRATLAYLRQARYLLAGSSTDLAGVDDALDGLVNADELEPMARTLFQMIGWMRDPVAGSDDSYAGADTYGARTDLDADQSMQAMIILNRAMAALSRLQTQEDIAPLHRTIDETRQLATVMADQSANWAAIQVFLCVMINERFARTQDEQDLEEIIMLGAQALATLSPGRFERSMLLDLLANALLIRHLRDGDSGDGWREAARLWEEAARDELLPALSRLTAARRWGQVAMTAGEWHEACRAFTIAIDVLPLLAWRGLDHEDAQEALAPTRGLAGEACAAAIAAGQPDLAVELLEQARGVLWTQLLDGNTDLTALREDHPQLADEMEAVRGELDNPNLTAGFDDSVSHTRALMRRWNELVGRVRELEGWQHLLKPPRIDDLRSGMGDSDIVVLLNVSSWRSDALIVDKTSVRVVELPDLDLPTVLQNHGRYLNALTTFDRHRSVVNRLAMERTITETLIWLWHAATAPVMTLLGLSPSTDRRTISHVWWCPTGPLTLFPVHAAGDHTVSGATVLDRVISSYTPTLRALSETPSTPRTSDPGTMVLVGMNETPGAAPLPQVRQEISHIQSLLDGSLVLDEHSATVQTVKDALGRYSIAHLSCHGTQNLERPSRGGILLRDGLLTMNELSTGPGRHLAVLTACQTATTGTSNPDEAISLASAMQYHGWGQVIATLWSVADDTSFQVVQQFYTSVAEDGQLMAGRAAGALHDAVVALRDREPLRPSRWSAFIHAGRA
ncbi:tetratricopeptide (TPR) repeat protein [Allocatelliglobosispora scoriae]|uniref:Tetratricopeptide (TPR) repeat protein n=1 Tax=Allocatelliglobosispora scoriae TaxID=643052 RepID=A0A841BPF2_9ACTN|nr:CHAT domain-containing protein [Allocatelliglobosispora scoriae]MBB5868622.1 tetratricopeptide (TPR) repeat protein [Allocatelliglobosispora scoriae]